MNQVAMYNLVLRLELVFVIVAENKVTTKYTDVNIQIHCLFCLCPLGGATGGQVLLGTRLFFFVFYFRR